MTCSGNQKCRGEGLFIYNVLVSSFYTEIKWGCVPNLSRPENACKRTHPKTDPKGCVSLRREGPPSQEVTVRKRLRVCVSCLRGRETTSSKREAASVTFSNNK